MIILDRKQQPLNIGDTVSHLDRPGTGVIVSIDPDHLPLVGVDRGGEFIRYTPYFDLTKDENNRHTVTCPAFLESEKWIDKFHRVNK